jgi:hypothetical protein
MKHIRKFLIGAACLMSLAASAQWQWVDKDGRKVFSDRPPQADIPDKNILKRAGGRAPTAGVPEVAAAAASAPQAASSAPKLGGIDIELIETKKNADEAELAKRKAQEEQVVKAKVENCARAKQAKSNFDAGTRIARTNEKGEREIMDDAARAAEVKRIQLIIESDCR